MPPRFALPLLAVALLLTLGACAGELSTPGEPMRVLGATLPNAILHEPYQQVIHVVGGLRPYNFEVENGKLPPGITLQNGTFRGAASEAGIFEVSVKVSDANLNQVVQSFVVTVTAPPPPSISLEVPLTEVREAVTLRATVKDARGVTALRSLLRWDPALFSLSASGVSATGRGTKLMWREAEGELQVDLVALGSTIDGDRELYRFTLEPFETPTRLNVDYQIEFLAESNDPDRRHDFVRGSEGRSPVRVDDRESGANGEPGEQGNEPADEPPLTAPGDGEPDGDSDPSGDQQPDQQAGSTPSTEEQR